MVEEINLHFPNSYLKAMKKERHYDLYFLSLSFFQKYEATIGDLKKQYSMFNQILVFFISCNTFPVTFLCCPYHIGKHK